MQIGTSGHLSNIKLKIQLFERKILKNKNNENENTVLKEKKKINMEWYFKQFNNQFYVQDKIPIRGLFVCLDLDMVEWQKMS